MWLGSNCSCTLLNNRSLNSKHLASIHLVLPSGKRASRAPKHGELEWLTQGPWPQCLRSSLLICCADEKNGPCCGHSLCDSCSAQGREGAQPSPARRVTCWGAGGSRGRKACSPVDPPPAAWRADTSTPDSAKCRLLLVFTHPPRKTHHSLSSEKFIQKSG